MLLGCDAMEDNFKKLELFFKINLEIKNIMVKSAPSSEDNYSTDSRIKYGDKLYFALEDLKYLFERLFKILNNEYLVNHLDKLFSHYHEELLACDYSFKKMEQFYQNNISNMNKELLDEMKKTFVGYTLFNSLGSVIGDVKTINELLHALHSYVLNDENIYQSMPIISQREILNGESITLYGTNNKIAKDIFDNISVDADLGITDILAFDNKIMMMVRDLGHALTIEIDLEEDKCMVRYFIPKVCNYIKANKLKGINKVKETDNFANGQFECSKEEITSTLLDFLSNVPTDKDMFELNNYFTR